MTPKEAIKTLEITKAEVEWDYPLDYAIAIDMAITTLEKQIPRKPLNQSYEYDGIYGNCPCCGEIVVDYPDDFRVCSNCRQKLDWGNEE